MFKTKWIVSLFITILSLLIIWLFIDAHQLESKRSQPNNPDAFMTNIHGLQINKLGKLQSLLSGPEAEHFLKNNTTLFTKPTLKIKTKKGPAWVITADSGEAINGFEKIVLTGNVRIHQPPGPGSRNLTFITSKLNYFPDRSIATTDDAITIEQPGSIVHGIGLKANLKKGLVKILSQTKAQYGTTPKKPLK